MLPPCSILQNPEMAAALPVILASLTPRGGPEYASAFSQNMSLNLVLFYCTKLENAPSEFNSGNWPPNSFLPILLRDKLIRLIFQENI